MLLSTHESRAQTPCGWLTDYYIDIVPVLPGTNPNAPGCAQLDCDEILFEVYVRAVDTNTVFFPFRYLTLLGLINTNGVNTYIDVNRSLESCSPSWPDDVFSVENDPSGEGIVAFSLGDAFVDTTYRLDLVSGSALLFTVAVHAGPGDVISWENPHPNSSTNPYLSVIGGLNSSCSGELDVAYDGNANPNTTLPAPATCSGFGYYFDVPFQVQNVPLIGFTNPIQIPIRLTGLSSGTAIEKIEAVVEVRTSKYMDITLVGSDIFPCTNIFDPTCSIEYRDYTQGGYFIRSFSSLKLNDTLSSSNDRVYNLTLLGPLNSSIGDTVQVTVKYLRVIINGQCCIMEFDDTGHQGFESATVIYQGIQNSCTDYTLNVTELSQSSTTCEIGYRISLDWTTPPSAVSMDQVRFRLWVRTDGDLNPSIKANTFGGTCASVSQLSTNLYELTLDTTSYSNLISGRYVDLAFSGSDGCITGYLFAESFLDRASYQPCIPELNKAYTTGNYPPVCFNKLQVNIHYKMTQDCGGEYLLKADADSIHGSVCSFSKVLENQTTDWSFCACRSAYPYEVSLERLGSGDYLENLSTYDLVLIHKNVLGIEEFNNPFKEVAADINCNGAITTQDIGVFRQFILGYNPSVAAPAYKVLNGIPISMPYPQNSTNAVDYCVDINNITITQASTDINFYVVKTGDVSWNDNTHPVSCFTGNNSEDRVEPVEISMVQGSTISGQIIRVPVVLKRESTLGAWQMSIRFDPDRVHLLGVDPGDAEGQVFYGIPANNEGQLRLLWYHPETEVVQLGEGAVLCYLEFAVLQDVQPNVLTLDRSSSRLEALAFGPQGTKIPMVLKNEQFVRGIEMQLFPNPFTEATQLLVDMPESEHVVISVHDVTGTAVGVRNLFLSAGRTELPLTSMDFKNRTGVFTITLQTASGTVSRKIVKF